MVNNQHFLTHNLSFKTRVFPAELNVATVVPIFKSDDEKRFHKLQTSICLPFFPLKIIGQLINNKLNHFTNENGLLYRYQFGYQKGKSTSMALVTLIDKITKSLDKGEWTIGVFLDLSKAVDEVDRHMSFITSARLYGIEDIMLH